MNTDTISEDLVRGILVDIVESLVEDPATAYVEMDSTADELKFGVDVPEDECAKIIGSNGRVIKGLQSVIGAMGGKIGKDVKIDIIE